MRDTHILGDSVDARNFLVRRCPWGSVESMFFEFILSLGLHATRISVFPYVSEHNT